MTDFERNKARVTAEYEALINRKNIVSDSYNGIYDRYVYPVLTAAHAPIIWKYDMNPETNPYFIERLGINAVLNSGAIYLNGKYYLVARVEGNDRKSFFAVAESDSPVDGFRFWDFPVQLPDTEPEETNLQALIDAEKSGIIKNGKITCVISSKEGAYALERAKNAGIGTVVIPRKEYADSKSYSEAILAELNRQGADLIVLAGFMIILDECVTKAYPYRIINVHPALIPSFCGEGFYGLKVHEKALEYGVKVSGATIHFVNEKADAGAIILQGAVDVANDETPESLQKKIMENVEWKLLPKAVSLFCEDRISIKDGKAYVDLKD